MASEWRRKILLESLNKAQRQSHLPVHISSILPLLESTVREAESFSEDQYDLVSRVVVAKALEISQAQKISMDEAMRSAGRDVKAEAIERFNLSPCRAGDRLCFLQTVVDHEDYWREKYADILGENRGHFAGSRRAQS